MANNARYAPGSKTSCRGRDGAGERRFAAVDGSGAVPATLLDYRNTQAENYNKYFFNTKPDIDLYKYKTVRSGDVLEVYEYEALQKSQKGREKKYIEKKIEGIEEKTEEQIIEIRRKSISRASKQIKRYINANIGKWGCELPKFLTLTFKDYIIDLKLAN